MPIEISCTSCSKRLRVPDTAAGKRVKCPQCQTILSVPAAETAGASAGGGGDNYHLKTEDGQTFGPVPKKELDEWLQEGRITAECQLLKDGGDQWQWASDVYPQLAGGGAAADSTAGSSAGGAPQIDVGGSSAGGGDDNPFAFAAADSSPTARTGGGRRSSTSVSTTSSAGVSSSAGAGSVAGQSDKSKMVAGILGLLLGGWGIHRFYLGYTGIGIIQIFVTLFTCGIGAIWGVIEGIMILVGSMDRDAAGRPLKD